MTLVRNRLPGARGCLALLGLIGCANVAADSSGAASGHVAVQSQAITDQLAHRPAQPPKNTYVPSACSGRPTAIPQIKTGWLESKRADALVAWVENAADQQRTISIIVQVDHARGGRARFALERVSLNPGERREVEVATSRLGSLVGHARLAVAFADSNDQSLESIGLHFDLSSSKSAVLTGPVAWEAQGESRLVPVHFPGGLTFLAEPAQGVVVSERAPSDTSLEGNAEEGEWN